MASIIDRSRAWATRNARALLGAVAGTLLIVGALAVNQAVTMPSGSPAATSTTALDHHEARTLTGGAHDLTRWRSMLARSREPGGATSLLVVGDSTTEGVGSPTYRGRWVDRLRHRLQASHAGAGGVGFIPAAGLFARQLTMWPGGATSPWTYTGAAAPNLDYGFSLQSADVPAGETATISYFGSGAQLLYVATPAGPTAASVTVDGVEVGPVDARDPAVAPGQALALRAAGRYGMHTVVVTPNDGTMTIEGIVVPGGDVPPGRSDGVTVLGAGHSGYFTAGWATNSAWAAGLDETAPLGLAVIALGINDARHDVPAEDAAANIVTAVDHLDVAVGHTDTEILIVVMPTLDESYRDAYLKAAQQIGSHRAGVLDLAGLTPDRQWASALSDDNTHPNDAGQQWMAERVAEVVDPAPTHGVPPTPRAQRIDASQEPDTRINWVESWGATDDTGWDESPGGTTVGERRHRVWLDPGTYRATISLAGVAAPGEVEVLLGRDTDGTVELVSMGTVANPSSGSTTTRLATTVAITRPDWVPLIIRKTGIAGPIRFVGVTLDKR